MQNMLRPNVILDPRVDDDVCTIWYADNLLSMLNAFRAAVSQWVQAKSASKLEIVKTKMKAWESAASQIDKSSDPWLVALKEQVARWIKPLKSDQDDGEKEKVAKHGKSLTELVQRFDSVSRGAEHGKIWSDGKTMNTMKQVLNTAELHRVRPCLILH